MSVVLFVVLFVVLDVVDLIPAVVAPQLPVIVRARALLESTLRAREKSVCDIRVIESVEALNCFSSIARSIVTKRVLRNYTAQYLRC